MQWRVVEHPGQEPEGLGSQRNEFGPIMGASVSSSELLAYLK